MASIIITSKHFGSTLREVFGYSSLKTNRIIEKAMAKKNTKALVVIDLNKVNANRMASFIYNKKFRSEDGIKEQEMQNMIKQSTPESWVKVGLPRVEYTHEEWKTPAELLTGAPYQYPKLKTDVVRIDMSCYISELKPFLQYMVSKGSLGQSNKEIS